MEKEKITIEILDNAVLDNDILATGIILDNSTGLNMTTSGKPLRWVAVHGAIGDWCVYTHWEHNSMNFIKMSGDKVISRQNIDNILDINDEVWKSYRF